MNTTEETSITLTNVDKINKEGALPDIGYMDYYYCGIRNNYDSYIVCLLFNKRYCGC
jgi:hypothetical protein